MTTEIIVSVFNYHFLWFISGTIDHLKGVNMKYINLGCGNKKQDGWIGIDIRKFPAVDYVMNVGKEKLPFKDNSVDKIHADHLFEHFYPEELFFCIEECWRVLKPKGHILINVPKGDTPGFYIHPDHKIHFIADTFGFFQVPAGGKDIHGYLKGFWHVSINDSSNPHALGATLYPNKPNGHYPYQKVKLLGEY